MEGPAGGVQQGPGGRSMKEAFSQEVTIGRGGVVRVQSPDLPAGARARVVVLLEGPEAEPPPLASLVGRSKPCFKSAAEVDAFIRRERGRYAFVPTSSELFAQRKRDERARER